MELVTNMYTSQISLVHRFCVFGCWKLVVHISSIGIRGMLQFTPWCSVAMCLSGLSYGSWVYKGSSIACVGLCSQGFTALMGVSCIGCFKIYLIVALGN